MAKSAWVAALAAALALGACALGPPNSSRVEDAAAPAPPPPVAQTGDAPAPDGVAAPGVEAPPPDRPLPRGRDDVVVPGQTQLPPPDGDPRTVAQRREDIARWDRCVLRAQSAGDSDPTRPQLETPEETCRRTLGQASRTAVPASRR